MRKKIKEVDYKTLQFICSLASTLKPKENITITEWAERNMVGEEGSAMSGHFNRDNMPHQVAIMDAITDVKVRDVTLMTSSQIGKTFIILCGIGYYIDHEPSTQMMVFPELITSERFSKTRLATMIRDVPALSRAIAPAKAKDSSNTILFKQFSGGYIVISGSNSPSSLASMPCRVIWMDEVDRFADSAGTEGNPVSLAKKRATSYWNKKYIMTSTPTIAGRSKIESAYKKGTMEEWCVECPCCGKWQPYDFRRVVFDSVSMKCVECGEEIPERDWKESPHRWIAQHPERISHRSFHMNELGSPLCEWKDIIQSFKDAKARLDKYHDAEDLKVFVNTSLGECWEETELDENATDEETLEKRAEHYSADIPGGVIVLTAAIDVQDNRFEVEVRGWARDYESWGIYKTEIYGELIKDEVWDELEDYLSTTFYFEDGRELNIAAFAIDTGGHFTNKTYKWIKKMKMKGKKVYGVKGYSQKADIPLLYKRTVVDIKEERAGKKDIVVDHTVIQIVGVDSGKDDIMRRLTIEEKGEGYCHFPSNAGRGYDHEYYKGLLSESKIVKKVRGSFKTVWVKKSGVRNEPLDLFNYNYVCIEKLRPIWGDLEKKLERGVNYMKATRKSRQKKRRNTKGMEV